MKLSEKLKEMRKNLFMKLVSKEKVQSVKSQSLIKGNSLVDAFKYFFLKGFRIKIETKKESVYLEEKIGSKVINPFKIGTMIFLIPCFISLFFSDIQVTMAFLMLSGILPLGFVFSFFFSKHNYNYKIKEIYNENNLEEVYHNMENFSFEDKKILIGDHIKKDQLNEIFSELMPYVSQEKLMEKLKKIQAINENEIIQISNPVVIIEILKEIIKDEQEKERMVMKNNKFKKTNKTNENILNNIYHNNKTSKENIVLEKETIGVN